MDWHKLATWGLTGLCLLLGVFLILEASFGRHWFGPNPAYERGKRIIIGTALLAVSVLRITGLM